MPVAAVMVDVDGVLIRGRSDGRHWSATLEADLGLSPECLHREFFEKYWDDVIVGRVLLADALAPVLRHIAPDLSVEQLISYWFENDSYLDRALLEDLGDVRAAGIAVYLATNQEHMRADYLLREVGLAAHVDGIFYSAQLGVRKPQPAFYEAAATRAGLASSSAILLIDDTLENVRAAQAIGWRGLHWTDKGCVFEALQVPGLARRRHSSAVLDPSAPNPE
ncbi:HAD-IA family hydrolase [Microvirga puerhi]|uniref:HAD-IA family hydrolase n=1 Tax=Microvirga puerhi TaxID=2876078 RepID=A0ABS7VLW9_9HYPH|nr:HAD-IA family hydrolase [Microvirga puerhi]MBZ6076224.1 HAD-IA family hydrolase [Microvirga puerhi]